MELIYLSLGIIAGIAIGYLWMNQKRTKELAAIQAELQATKQLLSESQSRTAELVTRHAQLQSEYTEQVRLLSIAETQRSQLEQALKEKAEELKKLNEALTAQFENIANRVLEAKTQNISNTQQKWMQDILNPLKDKIQEFERKVHITHMSAVEINTALKTQIELLTKQSTEISKEAHNLANALKGQVKAQGNWGELILEKILERSGLQRDKEFKVQASLSNEEGKRLQPDVIVMLPENKSVIIDSKVSLNAYEQYVSTDDEAQKQVHLKNHIQAIRNHIKGLSEKKYQQLYQLNTVDFVLMFLPIEPAFALAVQHDSDLWSEAFEKNIVLVSTSTLLATLRTISMMWRQDRMNKNALEIAKKSGDLYDKFVGFTNDMIDMGKKLNTAQESYAAAMNKLSTGNGNIVRRLEELKKLGANSSKSLPQSIIERSEMNDNHILGSSD